MNPLPDIDVDMEWLSMERWSPYVVGIGIGLLSCLTFLLSDKPIGCSTAFSRASGMIEKLIRGGIVAEKAYYKKFTPVIEWEWMLVLGVFIGAFLSAILSGQFQMAWVPANGRKLSEIHLLRDGLSLSLEGSSWDSAPVGPAAALAAMELVERSNWVSAAASLPFVFLSGGLLQPS